jgi:hypothetical protein
LIGIRDCEDANLLCYLVARLMPVAWLRPLSRLNLILAQCSELPPLTLLTHRIEQSESDMNLAEFEIWGDGRFTFLVMGRFTR